MKNLAVFLVLAAFLSPTPAQDGPTDFVRKGQRFIKNGMSVHNEPVTWSVTKKPSKESCKVNRNFVALTPPSTIKVHTSAV